MTAQDEPELEEGRAGAAKGGSNSPYRRQMLRGNVLLVALFVAGAGLVYGLSLRKGPAQASAAEQTTEAQVDSVIGRLTQAPASGDGTGSPTQRLLKGFYDRVTDRQVPLDKLHKNPFVLDRQAPDPVAATVAIVNPAAPAPEPGKGSREQAMAALANLHLQSVMTGRSGQLALISNNLLGVGQKIEGFTVKSIDPQSVILVWEDREFELRMPE
jgi:hypothetical protein